MEGRKFVCTCVGLLGSVEEDCDGGGVIVVVIEFGEGVVANCE